MRRFAVLLGLAAVVASAQPDAALRSIVLFSALDQSWSGVGPALPPPDEGTVRRGSGTLMWSASERGVKRLGLVVEGGVVCQVLLQPLATETPSVEQIRTGLFALYGPPAEGGFYRWSQLSTWYGEASNENLFPIPVDLKPDVDQGLLIFRRAVEEETTRS